MNSLRARLFVVWALALASACAVGFLLVQLYRQSADAQIARAEAAVAHACERIGDSYAYYTTGWTPRLPAAEDVSLRADLKALVGLALSETPGMQGGIWQSEDGRGPVSLADAGTGPQGDERDRIAALTEAAGRSGEPESTASAPARRRCCCTPARCAVRCRGSPAGRRCASRRSPAGPTCRRASRCCWRWCWRSPRCWRGCC